MNINTQIMKINLITSTSFATLFAFLPMSCAPYYVSDNSGYAFREARYDSSGFPIYGYQDNRPIYGYNSYGAPIFALALLTAACFVPSWGPAHYYHGHYHYPHYVRHYHSIPSCAHSYRQKHYTQHNGYNHRPAATSPHRPNNNHLQRDHGVRSTPHNARPHSNSLPSRYVANGPSRRAQYSSTHSPSSSRPHNTSIQRSSHNNGRNMSPGRSGSSYSARPRSSH